MKFKIGLAISNFYPDISSQLEQGARKVLGSEAEIVCSFVSGSMELPLMSQFLFEHKKCDAVIALGAVIRGETSHYESVCRVVDQGLLQVQLEQSKPILSGVLMVENKAQAEARLLSDKNHKGEQAGLACLEILKSLEQLKS